jgi:hypothetical protein
VKFVEGQDLLPACTTGRFRRFWTSSYIHMMVRPTINMENFFPYLGIKNMQIDYKKCDANAILIVCMRFVPKNTMVNAVDYRNLDTLRLSVN